MSGKTKVISMVAATKRTTKDKIQNSVYLPLS